jgi:two-component system, NarL family, response regulator DegU
MINKTYTLIIADDHPLFRSGVRAELEINGEFRILGETGNGNEALKLIIDLVPDVAVLDFEMPGLNGLEITERLTNAGSRTKIILLTMHNEKKIFIKALNAGVKGYVLKDDAALDIVNAVNTVAAGREFISGNLTSLLLGRMIDKTEDNETAILIKQLTTAEKQMLSLISELKTNDEIADLLFISKRTVENHKVALTRKLGLESSRFLLKFAVNNKNSLAD